MPLSNGAKIALAVTVPMLVIGLIFLVLYLAGVFDKNPPPPPEPQMGKTYLLYPSDDNHNSGSYAQLDYVNSSGTPVVGPVQEDIQGLFDQVYNKQMDNAYGYDRYVFLLSPGTYYKNKRSNGFNVKLGYYCSVVGLGSNPDECVWVGKIEVPNDPNPCIGALDNFYRGLHNFTLQLPNSTDTNYFNTSQACPIRDLVVPQGTFAVSQPVTTGNPCHEKQHGDGNYSSGGFMSNCDIKNNFSLGTQQQFFVRNSSINNQVSGGAWNMFFGECIVKNSNDSKACPLACSSQNGKYTFVEQFKSPTALSPPSLVLTGVNDKVFQVQVPTVPKASAPTDSKGYSTYSTNVTYKNFIVVTTSTPVDHVNIWLEETTNSTPVLVFLPGVYTYQDSIKVTVPGTILMGLGYATIIPSGGKPAIKVSDVAVGVIISGFILEAGNVNSPSLLQVGQTIATGGNPNSPTRIYDIFARVATAAGKATTMIEINQNYVIVDHTWNWRADHDRSESGGLGIDKAVAYNGMVVNGNNVTVYGLFSEHFLDYCVRWDGDDGTLYFQQTELPYDVTANAKKNYDKPGLLVNGKNFFGQGIGVYIFFNDGKFKPSPTVTSAVVTEDQNKATIKSAFARFLNGSGSITHVVNNVGSETNGNTEDTKGPHWVCN